MLIRLYGFFTNCCKTFALKWTPQGLKVSAQKRPVSADDLEKIYREQKGKIAILDLSLETNAKFPRYEPEVRAQMVESLAMILQSSFLPKSLREIHLQGCYLIDTEVKRIINAIKGNPILCKNLTTLDLSHNAISESNKSLLNDFSHSNPKINIKMEEAPVPMACGQRK